MPAHKHNILIFFLLILFLLPGSAYSQVVVEKSKDKVIISGKAYYIHIVKKGETAYSISKAYGIKVDDLVNENPSAITGVREGESLRIPVNEKSAGKKSSPAPKQVNKDEEKFIYHKLETGDTVFSLAKKYGVSEQEIIDSNPGVEINRLTVGSEIAIPKRQFATAVQTLESQEKEIINYKVSKGESITSIAAKFGITVRELRKENKGVIFPRVDDYLRIPIPRKQEEVKIEEPLKDTLIAQQASSGKKVEKREGPLPYTVVGSLKGSYNIAVLLPLYYGENSKRTETDSSQNLKGKVVKRIIQRPDQWIYPETMTFLEMYQGILIAADTLRSMGLDLNISLYDIKSDTSDAVALIQSGKLENMDLIIGPVYSHNLRIIADYACSREIPVVSPVPLRNSDVLTGRPYLFMAFPSLTVAQQAISRRITDYYNDNFVLIHSDTAGVDPTIGQFKNMIFTELSKKIPYSDIKFKEFLFYNRSSIGSDSINRLEHALNEKSDNIILLASEDSPVLSETIMDLHTLSRKYPVRVIGYPAMREIDNLEPKYYFELGIELYSPYWIDYSRAEVKKFIRTYRTRFLSEPAENSFAWQGYDIAYFFLSGLAIHGKEFIMKPEIHNPYLPGSEFDFEKKSDDSGFENHKLFHIRYTGEMEVKLMEDFYPETGGIN